MLLRLCQPTDGPFLIAYEPAWAISTSENAQEYTPLEAADRQGFIRSVITGELGADFAAGKILLYGGSVTAANIDAYLTRPDIDGALVGTASEQLTTFQALINASITTYRRMQPGAGH